MYPDTARADRLFAQQFEPDGDGWVYRRSRKGAAFRLTAYERNRFVREFSGSRRGSEWILYAGAGPLMVGMIVLAKYRPDISLSSMSSLVAILAALFVLGIPYALRLRWIWNAPIRELRGRAPIAVERSPAEMRRVRLARLTYGQLALGAFVALVIAIPDPPRERRFPGWNHFALAVGFVVLLLVAVQTFRKWRFDRKNNDR
jgi:hypothetical protein